MKASAQPMEKVTFERWIETGRDGYGGSQGHWEDQLTAFVTLDFREGSEAVVAAHLEGTQPAILTIRSTAKARLIDRTWRLKHRGRVFEIAEPPRLNPRRTHISMKIEGTM